MTAAAGETTADAEPARLVLPTRLVSIDAFRGLTIVGMILVNNPGSWSSVYAPLRHAEWHGWTPTDLIFPFFLFIVGVVIPLALGGRLAGGSERGALLARAARRALIFDLQVRHAIARPFAIFGVNSIAVFVGSGLLAKTLGYVRVGERSLHSLIHQGLFASWLPAHVASLGYAIGWVVGWFAVLVWMDRRGIHLKV